MEGARVKRLIEEWSGKMLNGWEVGDYINSGKSALVFTTAKESQKAAIKIFDPELVARFGKGEELERIQRELQLVGHGHENLVAILDGGFSKEHDLFFVVMEFVEAPNLASILKEVPVTEIRQLISQIAAAARFLEELGLVHRDIKPDNVAVTTDFKHATLLDLGVIRPIEYEDPPLTDREEQVFVGTHQYGSPEFLLRKEDQNLDGYRALTFYQLGAVLYDMLEKRRIFSGVTSPIARLVQAILHDIPKIDPAGKPSDLVGLANNCLVKDPKLRLKIVRWDDFRPVAMSLDSTTAAKENIRKRRARAEFEILSGSSISDYQESRRRIQMSSEFVSRIAEQLRASSDENALPPRTIKELSGDENHDPCLIACYKSSLRCGLSVDFYLAFRVKLVDVNAQVIELQSAAAAATTTVHEKYFSDIYTTIFVGVYGDSAIRPVIEGALFPSFERAMSLSGPLETTLIQLSKMENTK